MVDCADEGNELIVEAKDIEPMVVEFAEFVEASGSETVNSPL